MKKYEILRHSGKYFPEAGRILYPIKALNDVKLFHYETLKSGTVGGYVESEYNLSQDGNSWIRPDSIVFGEARCAENAIISGKSTLFGKTLIKGCSCITDSKVYDGVVVNGDTIIEASTVHDTINIDGLILIESSSIRGYNNNILGDVTIKNSDLSCYDLTIDGTLGELVIDNKELGISYRTISKDTQRLLDKFTPKFELVDDDTKEVNGVIVSRIRALKDFADVVTGALGGYVESEANLSHIDDCWIYDEAVVMNESRVRHTATVHDKAIVSGCSDIRDWGKVYDKAEVFNSIVADHASVLWKSNVRDAELYNDVSIQGAAIVDNARLLGNCNLESYATIKGSKSKLIIGGEVKIAGNRRVTTDNDVKYLVKQAMSKTLSVR